MEFYAFENPPCFLTNPARDNFHFSSPGERTLELTITTENETLNKTLWKDKHRVYSIATV